MVQLIESGEKERLKELLRERLIECGWRDELKAQCRYSATSIPYLPPAFHPSECHFVSERRDNYEMHNRGRVGSRAFTRKKGRGNITVDELVRTITPKGRGRPLISTPLLK